jgi:hypothetical protein
MMPVYEQHPLSAAFPAMSISELSDLTMDIVNNGLRNPITLFEGMVLDGWHRYRACRQIADGEDILLAVEFPAELDPVAFVRSQNYHRRHLTAGQKAVAEVELSKWARVGSNQHGGSAPGAEAPEVRTTPQMAKAAEVGTRTIEQAKVVVEAGLADAVKAGEVSVKRAAEVAKLPEPERQAAIHAPRPAPASRPLPIRRPPAQDGEEDRLRALVAEREDEIKELTKLLSDTEEENKSFSRVIEADDQLAAAMAEAKRYRELARVTEERNNGMMGQNHALAKDARRWMNKFLRLERLHKGELAAADPEPNDEDLGELFPNLDPAS